MAINSSLRLVSLLIGQEQFEELLILLPDGFYRLQAETKNDIWDELLGVVNEGIEDPQPLAEMAMALINKAQQVSAPA